MVQLHELFRGDDGVMVRYLGIVHKERFCREGLHGKAPCQGAVRSNRAGLQPFLQGWQDVAGQISGICPGIGQHLMVLIQALHDVKGFLGRIVKTLVGVPLQLGQVIKKGSGCFLGRPPYLIHHTVFPFQACKQVLGHLPVKGAVTSGCTVLPGEYQPALPGLKPVIWFWDKASYVCFPLCNHCQGRRLDTAAG